ncbi:hypothetical protein E8E95_05585 [Pseudomonas sp. BN414]|uniref:hypothetical protein n=1 Tax=Pseudomonas sp. BN414 TaxID=2567888 RepID=UPI002454165D|nr:hypothetical protein [Pseudomonas sp. BN414]MDH4566144.1 hypothetical protein [Pseudomonas sp. BN414]
MGLPVHACSDEELMHYAGIDDGAAAELARRSVEFRGTYLHEINALKNEVEDLESQLESAVDDADDASDLHDAIRRVRGLLKDFRHMHHGQLLTAVEEALDEISDF